MSDSWIFGHMVNSLIIARRAMFLRAVWRWVSILKPQLSLEGRLPKRQLWVLLHMHGMCLALPALVRRVEDAWDGARLGKLRCYDRVFEGSRHGWHCFQAAQVLIQPRVYCDFHNLSLVASSLIEFVELDVLHHDFVTSLLRNLAEEHGRDRAARKRTCRITLLNGWLFFTVLECLLSSYRSSGTFITHLVKVTTFQAFFSFTLRWPNSVQELRSSFLVGRGLQAMLIDTLPIHMEEARWFLLILEMPVLIAEPVGRMSALFITHHTTCCLWWESLWIFVCFNGARASKLAHALGAQVLVVTKLAVLLLWKPMTWGSILL